MNKMTNNRKDIQILRHALQAFEKTTNLTAEVEFAETRVVPDRTADAMVRIAGWDMEWHFMVEIKNNVTPANMGAIINQLQTYPEKGLIATTYMTPQMAQRLKDMDIPFIDTVGNAYINEPPLFVFIKGNKPAEPVRRERPTRAFQPTGLQLIFALLCNPGLENTPYRQIAEVADVALGTIGWVVYDLKRMNYLVDMGKRGRRLVRKKELMNRWTAAYPEQLRPRLLLGRYRTDRQDWWKDARINDYKGLWGGEVAAAQLMRHLKPEVTTIYTKPPFGKLLLKHKLKKDPTGNVEILKLFWDFNNVDTYQDTFNKNLVHPLLIFADLLATGNPRNIEMAEILYDRHLTPLIGQD